MSGHSHWAGIKYKKGLEDAKRAQIFSKFSRLISIKAREKGGDPETNSELKMAIEKARRFNMPQENIERAIKKGTGEIEGGQLESLLIEAFGPGKIAILIEAITDNKNRTIAEIRHILEIYDGKIASGGVLWMFERKGVIEINQQEVEKNKEELEMLAIEAGADDIKWQDSTLEIYTKLEDLNNVKNFLEEKGIKIENANLEFVPKEEIKIEDKSIKEKIEKLFEALDEHDDVQNIYSNMQT
ncbi:MAG TPA: YebC/PmpR family DNA-binding transcriptional regulator [Candidatus Pacearchaeota archaeon]|nr:YebC/PmpR family DNA-binding transcriptional regulator [Candidatus Pacearchaeota archaeon]HOK94250.1 YebC/PmpR family DNA-binding transcriptional regulator [Candidatus Pacearchaeota archaeon]HPO75364.1 YebC/PmpR family DNA-binding transcriptional regulator [Candidatus Pacearchaeota archaeon]